MTTAMEGVRGGLPLRLEPGHRPRRQRAGHRLLGGDLPDTEPPGGDAGGRVRRIIYASGSGVYGDTGTTLVGEDYSPLEPISTYGASKLACEALICSYVHMFELEGVGVSVCQRGRSPADPRRRLRLHPPAAPRPDTLEILGDGSQSKSYIHVDDVLDALLAVARPRRGRASKSSTWPPRLLTVRQIADLVAERLGISGVKYTFTGGQSRLERGRPGRSLRHNETPEARLDEPEDLRRGPPDSIDSMIVDAKAGKFPVKRSHGRPGPVLTLAHVGRDLADPC